MTVANDISQFMIIVQYDPVCHVFKAFLIEETLKEIYIN